MFQVSDKLMRQCIEMVANEFDYIYPADGIDENYSVINLGADGVWIVNNLDDSKLQQIILPYTFEQLDYARKYHIPLLYL
jgi:hypothetical protein